MANAAHVLLLKEIAKKIMSAYDCSAKIEDLANDLELEKGTLTVLLGSIREFYGVVKDIHVSWLMCPRCGTIIILEPGEKVSNCRYHKDVAMVKLGDVVDAQGNLIIK